MIRVCTTTAHQAKVKKFEPKNLDWSIKPGLKSDIQLELFIIGGYCPLCICWDMGGIASHGFPR